MENSINLDNLDCKLLELLDGNCRQSISSISKKCRVHKNVVSFRINRMVERKIIRQFVAMISPTSLGLNPYKIHLKFQNLTSRKEEDFLALTKDIPLYWSAKVSGNWDFILGVLVKNTRELSQIMIKIINSFGEDIIRKNISLVYQAPHFYRKYLSNNPNLSSKNWLKEDQFTKLNSTDYKILKILANNARTPIVKIAQETGNTVKTIISRIKRLEKEKIIYDYRISLNLEKIGFHFYKCLIWLKKNDKEKMNDFLDYCHNNKNIIHVIQCLGEWDLELEIEIESFERFQSILNEIINNYADLIKNIEPLTILSEKSYICIPNIKE